MDAKFATLVGGRGIGKEGVSALEALGLELVYVHCSRPGLWTPSGKSADFSVGEKPDVSHMQQQTDWHIVSEYVSVWTDQDSIVASVRVGSAGDPYYNTGYFKGPKMLDISVHHEVVSALYAMLALRYKKFGFKVLKETAELLRARSL